MRILVFEDPQALGIAAARDAAHAIRSAIANKGRARIVAATGASQRAFLSALTRQSGVDWSRVEMFHLDEYIGLSPDHPASFRKYLMDRLIGPTGMRNTHLIDGEADHEEVCRTLGHALRSAPIDVAFVGIGENGHLAFNDPPADFDTDRPYIVVDLDEACRRQQVGEGWFASVDDVPRRAVSMSVREILRAGEIMCIVPERRKAPAVKATLEGEINPLVPASILRRHQHVTLYLDRESASLLDPRMQAS